MGVKRPGFKPNVKANLDSTKKGGKFVNIKDGATMRMRVLPPAYEDGMIFYQTDNHFKMKDAHNNDIALACLETHGTPGTCWLCKLAAVLKKHGDKSEKKIGSEIYVSQRWNIQVLIAEKQSDGTLRYEGPKLFGLSKTVAEEMSQIMANMQEIDGELFCDIEHGQDLMITRRGSGFNTKYTIDRTGVKSNLDEVAPGWEAKFITDMDEALGLRIVSPEEQKEAAVRAFGDALDWVQLAEEYGL